MIGYDIFWFIYGLGVTVSSIVGLELYWRFRLFAFKRKKKGE